LRHDPIIKRILLEQKMKVDDDDNSGDEYGEYGNMRIMT